MEPMPPKEQDRLTVVEKTYSLLIDLKMKKTTITYADCFEHVFGIPYSKKFLHFITERPIINNIPQILGAIGFACNDKGIPPLSCLVVQKESGKTGKLVVISESMTAEPPADFAQRVDLPAVYSYQEYPKPGSQEAADFLNLVMAHFATNGVATKSAQQ